MKPNLLLVARRLACLAIFVLAASLLAIPARAADPVPPAQILQDMKSFATPATALFIAAHPDDENTQLITFLSLGRHYRSGYLSINRGDGGQNVLGPEFGSTLGAIRTEELLAARRIDGGRQFFTRAVDFGYSKSFQESLDIWGHQEILSDVVRVIRTFKPDILVAGFSTQPAPNQHGHHTASAVLAGEAFKLAGDPKAFPDQLGEGKLEAWQPTRLLTGGRGGGGRRGGAGPASGSLSIDIGGTDPVSGQGFGAIANLSRSQHKTQGFGNLGGRGGGGGPQLVGFQVLDGEPATKDIMDGVDTTWGRFQGGAEIAKQIDAAIAAFKPDDPAASVAALLAIKKLAAAVPAGSVVDEKRAQLDRIIAECLGLSVETTVASAEAVPGEPAKLHETASIKASVPVRWIGTNYPLVKQEEKLDVALKPGEPTTRDATETIPPNAAISQPYWLREEPETGRYRVADPSMIGMPKNPPAFPVENSFEIDEQTIKLAGEPVLARPADSRALPRPLLIVAPVSLEFASETRLFAPGSSKSVEVEATAFHPGESGTLKLDAPAGWKVEPAAQTFKLAGAGDKTKLSFNVTAPAQAAEANISAEAEVGGAKYNVGRIEIGYTHITHLLLQPPASIEAVALDLKTRGKTVGYLPGAGDTVAQCVEQMGYDVKMLGGKDLTADGLKGLDAVVLGVRAFNVRDDLAAGLPALFDYAKNGGTVIVQYNRPGGGLTDSMAPFALHLGGNAPASRVTNENAAVSFLAPDHPALNIPNKITEDDFKGWVQEQGIYYPDTWGPEFTPILASSDPGEAPLQGGLLVAKDGKGYFVYTGLVFFRELPAGVPGAYRLFANLLSLGKE